MSGDQLEGQTVQPTVLLPQRRAYIDHGIDQLTDQCVAEHQITDDLCNDAAADAVEPDAKRPQPVPDRVSASSYCA
ncbi:hypothetical protein [Bradyrhizobium sp. SZCCHNRI1073]|uniref:hypothetical protein n=1 Tax=Bradyrhizobium sp. SZCCHNRI1073 TaxID=3057280 RepID=UPI003967641A